MTEVTPADCTTDRVVKYTATVTFEGKTYTDTTDNVTLADTALGHDWDTIKYTWSDDNTTVTALRACKRDHDHDVRETVNATYSVTKEATTMEEGTGLWTSDEFEYEEFEVQTKPVTIPKIPGWHINLTNYASNTAQTTLDSEMLYANGEVTFTATNMMTTDVFPTPVDVGCVIAVKNADGTYTPLACTTENGEHSFTVTMNGADIDLVLVVRGDANLNGRVDGPDATLTKKVVLEIEGYDPGPIRRLAMDTSRDGRVSGPDLTLMKKMILGTDTTKW